MRRNNENHHRGERYCVVCRSFHALMPDELALLDYMKTPRLWNKTPIISCTQHTPLEIRGAWQQLASEILPHFRSISADTECRKCGGEGVVRNSLHADDEGDISICACIWQQLPTEFEGKINIVGDGIEDVVEV